MFDFCSMGPLVKKNIINKRGRKKERKEEGREEGRNKDNLSDTNKLFNTSWSNIFSENCQIGQKAESFYRIKNKGREKENGKISDWLGPPHLGWEGTRRQYKGQLAWRSGTGWFWSSRALTRTWELSLSSWARVAPSWV